MPSTATLKDTDTAAARWAVRQEPRLSEKHFREMAALVESYCGIHLPPAKRLMLEARVRKRLRALGMDSFSDYYRLLETDPGNELIRFIDVVTVNKTDFFREPGHFDFLTAQALPEMLKTCGAGLRAPLRVWSAACSTGEEPYTLAMVLAEYAAARTSYQFSILATDICTDVLEKARTAIYPVDSFKPVPFALRQKYLLKSKDPEKGLGRVAPAVRALVEFRRLNLMDRDFGIPYAPDVIFCRNVMIYFERHTQERLIGRLVDQLRPGGYLFMGHSETLHVAGLPVEPVAPTVYRRFP